MSTTTTITLTRQELYEQVWTIPMRKLAASYGLSDVSLAKICDKQEVPRPERGHWARKAFGQEPPRTPLPDCADPELQTVVLQERTPREPGPQPKPPGPVYDEDIQEVLERGRSLPKVTVGTTLRNLHPLVESTRVVLEDSTPDNHNMLCTPRYGEAKVLCVSVSKANIRRGLAYRDALVKAVERIGGRVDVTISQWKRETTVSFCGDQAATIRLRERYNQVPRSTPPKSAWDWQKYEFPPTGRLLLDRAANSYGSGRASAHRRDTARRGTAHPRPSLRLPADRQRPVDARTPRSDGSPGPANGIVGEMQKPVFEAVPNGVECQPGAGNAKLSHGREPP